MPKMNSPGSLGFKTTVFLLVTFFCVSSCSILEGRHISKEDYLEAKWLMKRSRRPRIKSIHLEDGDIYDCVPIEKQLAFEHPALKNHTIQMKPTSIPEFVKKDKSSNHTRPYVGLKGGGCPVGSVPVRRLQIEDILRSPSSVKSFGRKNSVIVSEHHWAAVEASGEFYGTRGSLNIWNPSVKSADQFSLSQLWVVNGGNETIEAGWHVYPQLFGGNDNRTRFFIYWTTDNYDKTGCYNTLCPGFVQVSTKVAVGVTLDQVSTYQGHQYEMELTVVKDAKTKNWWIYYSKEPVGYWPSSLYKGLGSGAANAVNWGGEALSPNTKGQWPPMGSSHFPLTNGDNIGKSCFISNIQISKKDSSWDNYPLNAKVYQDAPQCYKLLDFGIIDSIHKRFIAYGGPGGTC